MISVPLIYQILCTNFIEQTTFVKPNMIQLQPTQLVVTLKRRRIENAARRETELDEQRLNAKEKRKKRQAAIDEALVCNVSESMAFSFSTLYS